MHETDPICWYWLPLDLDLVIVLLLLRNPQRPARVLNRGHFRAAMPQRYGRTLRRRFLDKREGHRQSELAWEGVLPLAFARLVDLGLCQRQRRSPSVWRAWKERRVEPEGAHFVVATEEVFVEQGQLDVVLHHDVEVRAVDHVPARRAAGVVVARRGCRGAKGMRR